MRQTLIISVFRIVLLLIGAIRECRGQADVPQQSFLLKNGLTINVKQVAPGNQESAVQIICYLKHKPAGDRVLEALVDFNNSTGGLIQSLRNSGQFGGDERETLFLTPPGGQLKAKSILLIGLGEESKLSLDTMSRIGITALREAIRLNADVVSYASAIKDQGVDRLEAGQVAERVILSVIRAYKTELQLQSAGNSPKSALKQWIYEAGPAYFESTVSHVRQAVTAADDPGK